ncbi:MAG: hypothetical protein HKO92_07865 [Flavobacteriaceae bacterium]|nr:hypothetical protein [Flavobacteriaceae bacterium]
MKLNTLNVRTDIDSNSKLARSFNQLENLLKLVSEKELPEGIINTINTNINELNAITDTGKVLRRQIRKKQTNIIKLLENELKIVPKNYYRNTWLAIGMGAFGVPIGVAFGISLKNMGLLGAGLPIGLAIGLGIGAGMDKKAFNEGRQLDIEIKY